MTPLSQTTAAPVAEPIPAPTPPRARIPLGELLPVRRWWSQGIWRQTPIAFFLIAALAPFALLHLGGDPDHFRQVTWGFSAYFALIWFLVIRALVRPEPLPWGMLARTAIFTLVVGGAVAVALEGLLNAGTFNPVRSTLEVGVPEEIAKLLAVYVFVFRSKTLRSPQAFLFVGAISGLAFGASEAVEYTALYAGDLSAADYSSPLIVETIWRLVTDSLLHACLAGIAAFFLGLAAHTPAARKRLIAFGLGLAAVLHGLYDTYSDGWAGFALAAVIVAVFCGYVVTGARIQRRLAELAGTALPRTTSAAPAAPAPAAPVGLATPV